MARRRRLSAEQAHHLRDHAEAELARAVEAALRSFLNDVREASLSAVRSGTVLTAATSPEPLPRGELPLLGAQAARWAASVDALVVGEIEAIYSMIYAAYGPDLIVTSAAEQGMQAFISTVRDRLVRGTHFGVPVYEESFEAVRVAVAQANVEGWDRRQLAQRIAAELSWGEDIDYWQGQKNAYAAKIDALLDPLGPVGSPAREWARLHDPTVQALRDQMNRATKHLDDAESLWSTRANLIARTESTATANYGALAALTDEGATRKQWLAARDDRTRPSHAEADGQEAAIDSPFSVGGYGLQFPGDPAAPVHEVANCRCTMIASDYDEG